MPISSVHSNTPSSSRHNGAHPDGQRSLARAPCPPLSGPTTGLRGPMLRGRTLPSPPASYGAPYPRAAPVACGCCRPLRGRFSWPCWGPARTPIPSTNLAPGHSPHTAPPPPVSRRRTPGCSIKSCLRPSCASRSALAGFCLLVADSQRGSASSARPQRDVF